MVFMTESSFFVNFACLFVLFVIQTVPPNSGLIIFRNLENLQNGLGIINGHSGWFVSRTDSVARLYKLVLKVQISKLPRSFNALRIRKLKIMSIKNRNFNITYLH